MSMVTKGIIKKIPANNLNSPDYKFDVRIPVFEEAGSNTEFIIKSCLCYNEKESYNYKVNDVVYVTFEDNNLDKPIILGKLWCSKNKEEEKVENTTLPDSTYYKGAILSKYIENKIIEEQNNFNKDLPSIEVTSLSKVLPTSGVDVFDTMSLNVTLGKGDLKAGDEITICERCKSKRKPIEGYPGKIRYVYRVLKKYTLTEEDIAQNRRQFSVQIEELDTRVYRHNNMATVEGPAIRFVRLRRKISDFNSIFSNTITVRFSYNVNGDRKLHMI